MQHEPVFLDLEIVLKLHKGQIETFGGTLGIRDKNLLESAIAQPQNIYAYDDGDIFDMAASYAFHISKNHPFLDGNKRTGLQAALTFLYTNGVVIQIEQPRLLQLTLALVTDRIDKKIFAEKIFLFSCADLIDFEKVVLTKEEIANHANLPKDVRSSLQIDTIVSRLRATALERCEELGINIDRFKPIFEVHEMFMFPLVPKNLRSQFGIKNDVSDLEKGWQDFLRDAEKKDPNS